MAHKVSVNLRRIYLGEKAVYPLFLAVGVGCSVATWRFFSHNTGCPDVRWDRSARTNPFKYTEDEGKAWKQGSFRIVDKLRSMDYANGHIWNSDKYYPGQTQETWKHDGSDTDAPPKSVQLVDK